MRAVVYEVIAHIDSRALVDAYLDWLGSGHVLAVLDGGARTAMVTVYDAPRGWAVESRYVFPTQEAFEAYESGAGVQLNEDGQKLFSDRHGVRFNRQVGKLAFRLP